jgi:hypothetical protein
MRRFVFLSLAALTVCVICQSAPPQSRISSEPRRGEEETDRDNVIKRHEWFRSGRHGTNRKSAAALRLEAYQQMVARRKVHTSNRESPQPATHTAGGSSTTSTTSQTWSLLGPSPILSNINGSASADYDYGPVVGRVTSLFVDPADATGNTVYLGGATGGLWPPTRRPSRLPL